MTAPHPAAVAFLTATPVRMFEPLEDQFPTITRYWNDPFFSAELDAETQANRDVANAAIDVGVRAQLKALGYI